MLRKIQHSITEYLKIYNTEKGYQIILSGTFGGQLLYGNPSIEITKDVVAGLNIEYGKTRQVKK
jgi:outer membrane protein